MKFFDRRVYTLQCNWKVYVDNYLDGGYHVPHAHKGLNSVIEYTKYTIENLERACLQSSPLSSGKKSEGGVSATRQGRAFRSEERRVGKECRCGGGTESGNVRR